MLTLDMLQPTKQLIIATSNIPAKAVRRIRKMLPRLVYTTRSVALATVIRVRPKTLRHVAVFLKNSTLYQFKTLTEIAVVDRPSEVNRFSVRYCFLSYRYNQRVIVELYTNETRSIPSLTLPVFPSSYKLGDDYEGDGRVPLKGLQGHPIFSSAG